MTLPWPKIPDISKLTRRQRLALHAKLKYHANRRDPKYMERRRAYNRQWMKRRYYELRKDPAYLERFRAMRREQYHKKKKKEKS